MSLRFRPAVEMLQVLVIYHLGCHVGATFTIVNVPEVQCCTRLDQKTYDTGGASCFCMQGLHKTIANVKVFDESQDEALDAKLQPLYKWLRSKFFKSNI